VEKSTAALWLDGATLNGGVKELEKMCDRRLITFMLGRHQFPITMEKNRHIGKDLRKEERSHRKTEKGGKGATTARTRRKGRRGEG